MNKVERDMIDACVYLTTNLNTYLYRGEICNSPIIILTAEGKFERYNHAYELFDYSQYPGPSESVVYIIAYNSGNSTHYKPVDSYFLELPLHKNVSIFKMMDDGYAWIPIFSCNTKYIELSKIADIFCKFLREYNPEYYKLLNGGDKDAE